MQFLHRELGHVAAAGDEARLPLESVVPRVEHLLGEVDRPVAGGLRTDQRAAPPGALTGQRPGELVGEAFVLPEEEADLPAADPDVPGRDIGIRTDVALQLGHERLAKAHHLGVALALGVEVRPALAAAERQRGQGVLEHLLEGEELEDGGVDRGMEAESALVGPDRAVHLDPEAPVHLDLPRVVDPGDPELDQALGLHHAVEDPRRAVLGVPLDDDGHRFDDLPDGLVEFGLVRVPRRDLVQDRLDIAHGPSGEFGRGL